MKQKVVFHDSTDCNHPVRDYQLCDYCGATLDSNVYKCTNCGGLAKQQPKTSGRHKNKFLSILFLCIALSVTPFIYKKHLEYTAHAVVANLPQNAQQQQTSTLKELSKNISESNEKYLNKKGKTQQVLYQLSPIISKVESYYRRFQYLPESMSNIGLNMSSFETGGLIDQIHMLEKAQVKADLNRQIFGQNKHINYTPKVIMGGMNIEWDCSTNLDQLFVPVWCGSIILR